jgi:hypothetical protein
VDFTGRVLLVLGTCPTLRFTVDANVVLTNTETTFRRGNCRDVDPGERVRVKGVRLPDGTVEAREVTF